LKRKEKKRIEQKKELPIKNKKDQIKESASSDGSYSPLPWRVAGDEVKSYIRNYNLCLKTTLKSSGAT
jgi:hypothetical protein